MFTVNGHAIDRRTFRGRIWEPLLRREGIAYRKPSALRHNFCSWLLYGGISVIEAAKITGHDPKVLLDSYADVVNEATKIPDLFSE